MSASAVPHLSALEATLHALADGQRALGDTLQRLYAALRGGDIDEIDRAVSETREHSSACDRLQHDLEAQQAAAGATSLHTVLTTLLDTPGSVRLLMAVESLTHEVARVSGLRGDIASLTTGLISINQQMIAAVSRKASASPTYDAPSSRRPARINTRLIDASA
jgi:hypothetical protein